MLPENPSIVWCKVPPAVPFTPAVPASTRVSFRMKPPQGRDSSGNTAWCAWCPPQAPMQQAEATGDGREVGKGGYEPCDPPFLVLRLSFLVLG